MTNLRLSHVGKNGEKWGIFGEFLGNFWGILKLQIIENQQYNSK